MNRAAALRFEAGSAFTYAIPTWILEIKRCLS